MIFLKPTIQRFLINICRRSAEKIQLFCIMYLLLYQNQLAFISELKAERMSLSAQSAQRYLSDLIDCNAILNFTLGRNHTVVYLVLKDLSKLESWRFTQGLTLARNLIAAQFAPEPLPGRNICGLIWEPTLENPSSIVQHVLNLFPNSSILQIMSKCTPERKSKLYLYILFLSKILYFQLMLFSSILLLLAQKYLLC